MTSPTLPKTPDDVRVEQVASELRELLRNESQTLADMSASIGSDGADREKLDAYLNAARGLNVAARKGLPILLDALARLSSTRPSDENGRGAIILEMAAASEEHELWERRWNRCRQLYAQDLPFADQGGRWGIRGLLTYMGKACGFRSDEVAGDSIAASLESKS